MAVGVLREGPQLAQGAELDGVREGVRAWRRSYRASQPHGVTLGAYRGTGGPSLGAFYHPSAERLLQ